MKLRKSSIYLAGGRLARFTGTFAGNGNPIFSAHGDEVIVPMEAVKAVSRNECMVYLGRVPEEVC